jgi:hypothetical protein
MMMQGKFCIFKHTWNVESGAVTSPVRVCIKMLSSMIAACFKYVPPDEQGSESFVRGKY